MGIMKRLPDLVIRPTTLLEAALGTLFLLIVAIAAALVFFILNLFR